jgi:phage gp29-like protein
MPNRIRIQGKKKPNVKPHEVTSKKESKHLDRLQNYLRGITSEDPLIQAGIFVMKGFLAGEYTKGMADTLLINLRGMAVRERDLYLMEKNGQPVKDNNSGFRITHKEDS